MLYLKVIVSGCVVYCSSFWSFNSKYNVSGSRILP